MSEPLFAPGATVATPGALEACEEANVAPSALSHRHATGDYGDLDGHDRRENEYAIKHGFRVLSAYALPTGERLYVITEADRSSTCLLLPSEY